MESLSLELFWLKQKGAPCVPASPAVNIFKIYLTPIVIERKGRNYRKKDIKGLDCGFLCICENFYGTKLHKMREI